MKYSNPLISALLIGSGLLNLVAPVLAAEIPTKAGNSIDNTANATYEDPTGLTVNSTSNPVTVVVAVVAGIDVAGSGIVDTTPADSIKVGDTLLYNYTVTNTGNDKTDIHIPANPAITGPGTLTKVEFYNPTSTDPAVIANGGWQTVPTGGVTVPNVASGATVPVRVVLVVNNDGTNNNVIKVQLGDTPNDAPNQPLSADGKNGDINTSGGTPANGQRESSATQTTSVGSIVKNMALATVTEKLLTPNNGVPSDLKDDVLTYQLGLNVAQTDVTNSGITPASLAGTPIKLGTGPAVDRILVSSAIPAGTSLSGLPTAPTGWIAVYTTDATGTNANAATWSTTAPVTAAEFAAVTRVGFVNDPTISKVVAPGDSVSGFTFKVITDKLTAAQVTANKYAVDSMAQLFGTTDGSSTPTVPGPIIYDESGDKMPNNWETGSAPLDPTVSTFTATMPSANGVADPVAYGKDTGNDNTGTGLAGEVNEYTYGYVAPTAVSLLNGPKDVPGAVGPDATTNSDFSDKSSAVPAGIGPNTSFDPDPVGFFNTVKNTGTAPADVSLLPQYNAADKLPVGTTVRIYTSGAASQSAIYQVTPTGYTFVSGTAATVATTPTATSPVMLAGVTPGGIGQYQVEINLPKTATTLPNTGFPVAVNAYTGGVIAASASTPGADLSFSTTPTADAQNLTIDKVYTGFIKLTKETRILQGTGPVVATADAGFSGTSKTPAQGNIIEYRITYVNVADKAVGAGNVVLDAKNLVITEDGTTTLNTWGQDKDSNGVIDTSNVFSSAVGSNGSVSYFSGTAGNVGGTDKSGTTPDADVTKYINTLTTVVAPGQQGTFTFQRKLN